MARKEGVESAGRTETGPLIREIQRYVVLVEALRRLAAGTPGGEEDKE